MRHKFGVAWMGFPGVPGAILQQQSALCRHILRFQATNVCVLCHSDGHDQVIFKERWRQKEARLRRASKLGQAREWRLLPVIGEDKELKPAERRPIGGVGVKALSGF